LIQTLLVGLWINLFNKFLISNKSITKNYFINIYIYIYYNLYVKLLYMTIIIINLNMTRPKNWDDYRLSLYKFVK